MVNREYYLIIGYLAAIVAANLLVTQFGPSVVVINAFLFIGLDLTARDFLHERWQSHLWAKMGLLIMVGSLLSYILNRASGQIAISSFVAFAGAGVVDTLIYWLLGNKSRLLKINGSNVASSGIDSLLFPMIAFGWPPLWSIILGQFVAKIGGGFIWSLILRKI